MAHDRGEKARLFVDQDTDGQGGEDEPDDPDLKVGPVLSEHRVLGRGHSGGGCKDQNAQAALIEDPVDDVE